MQRLIRTIMVVLACIAMVPAAARKYPVIKFEKMSVDMGTFSQDEPVRVCIFKFTNVGDAKLVINYVRPSCGCTVAEYPKDFISPGGSGEIKVTYNGNGKLPGKIKKYIQVFTNCKDDLSRIFITGEMTAVPKSVMNEDKKKEEK